MVDRSIAFDGIRIAGSSSHLNIVVELKFDCLKRTHQKIDSTDRNHLEKRMAKEPFDLNRKKELNSNYQSKKTRFHLLNLLDFLE